MPPPTRTLAEFNGARADALRPLLTECLAVPRRVETVLAGRPYADLDALTGAARAALPLSAGEVHAAMAAHPRAPAGGGTSGRGDRARRQAHLEPPSPANSATHGANSGP